MAPRTILAQSWSSPRSAQTPALRHGASSSLRWKGDFHSLTSGARARPARHSRPSFSIGIAEKETRTDTLRPPPCVAAFFQSLNSPNTEAARPLSFTKVPFFCGPDVVLISLRRDAHTPRRHLPSQQHTSHPSVANMLVQPAVSRVTVATARAQATRGIEVHTLPSRPNLDLWMIIIDDMLDARDLWTRVWIRTWTTSPWTPRCSTTISPDPLVTLHDTRSAASLTPRHGSFLRPRSPSHMPPPSRSHVRIPWSGQNDKLDCLLRGQGLVPLWVQKAPSHFRLCIHASAFLNHWTSGTLSLQGWQIAERVPIISSAVEFTWSCSPSRKTTGMLSFRTTRARTYFYSTFSLCGSPSRLAQVSTLPSPPRNATVPDDLTVGRGPAHLIEGSSLRRPQRGRRR